MSEHSSQMTIDHEEIREWVEARGGHPATVKRTEKGGEPGLLRIDFPGYSGEDSLEEISWEDFFEKFEEANLAFVYQEAKASGEPSTFSKLVRRPDEMVKKRTSASSKSKAGHAPSHAKGAHGEQARSKRKGADEDEDEEIAIDGQMNLDEAPRGASVHAKESHAKEGHAKEGHAKEGHANAKESHAKEGHAKEGHVKESHTKEGHANAKEGHAKEGHVNAKESHAKEGHAKAKESHAKEGHAKGSAK